MCAVILKTKILHLYFVEKICIIRVISMILGGIFLFLKFLITQINIQCQKPVQPLGIFTVIAASI